MGIGKLSRADKLRFVGLLLSHWALGLVASNRWPLALFARQGAGRWLDGVVAGFARRHPDAAVWADLPFARTLIVLDRDAMDQVLASSANTADPWIKKASVSTFAPNALVVSTHPEWRVRRAFNEEILGFVRATERPSPIRHADAFAAIVDDAVAQLAPVDERLRWDDFRHAAARISQQALFGAGAFVPEMAVRMARMVAASTFLVSPGDTRQRFDDELRARLAACVAAGPGAAEGLVADCAAHPAARGRALETDVTAQIAFWFFVLRDALELHVARTLALILSRSDVHARVRNEARAAGPPLAPHPWIEASLRESLRLWTPVPLLLRRVVTPFEIAGVALGEGDQILMDMASYHRDPRYFGTNADRFAPEAVAEADFPKVYYFSDGLQACAGQHLVVPLVTHTIAALLRRFDLDASRPQIDPDRVPHLVDHFALEFETRERQR